MKKPDALLTRGRLAAVVGHSHDSEAKGRSFQGTGALAKRPAPGGGKAAVFRRIGTPALCPGNGRKISAAVPNKADILRKRRRPSE